MNLERDHQSALALAEFFSGPEDQKLIRELYGLTRDYINKVRGLNPENLVAIRKAQVGFEDYRSKITDYASPRYVGERRSNEDRASRIRHAAAGIAKELFSHLNPLPVSQVQEPPKRLWDKFRPKPPEPPKALVAWQRKYLMQAAYQVITYASNQSRLYTQPVNPKLLDVLNKGILELDEDAKTNFPANIRLFVDNPHLEKAKKKLI